MTFDPVHTDGDQRAGLLSRRFRQGSTQTTDWLEADMRVVDADGWVVDADVRIFEADIRLDTGTDATPERASRPPRSSIPPTSPVTSFERNPTAEAERAPAVSEAQALWEIIPSATLRGDIALTEACLTAALHPPALTRPSWFAWSGWGTRSSSARGGVLTLELAGVAHRARLFLRGSTPQLAEVFEHLLATYGDVHRAVIPPDPAADADPLVPQSGEGVSFAELHLESPAILPLRLTGSAPDQLAGVIHTSVKSTEAAFAPLRVVSQLHMRQAPPTWKQRNQAFLDKQVALRSAPPASKSGGEGHQVGLSLVFFAVMVGLFLTVRGLLFLLWGVLPVVVIFASLGLVSLWRRWSLSWRLLRHEQEVREKLSQELVQVCLCLHVLGPQEATQAREETLDRLIRAYGAYAGLNRWRVGKRGRIEDVNLPYLPWNQQTRDGIGYAGVSSRTGEQYLALRNPDQAFRPSSRWNRLALLWGGDRARPILGTREVAALWHLPGTSGLQSYFQAADEPFDDPR